MIAHVGRGVLLVIAAVFVAMLLSRLDSTKWRAESALHDWSRGRPLQIAFGPQRYRGVLCGRFRIEKEMNGSDWRPFVYIDHYSADAPAKSLLLIDREALPAQAKFGCTRT